MCFTNIHALLPGRVSPQARVPRGRGFCCSEGHPQTPGEPVLLVVSHTLSGHKELCIIYILIYICACLQPCSGVHSSRMRGWGPAYTRGTEQPCRSEGNRASPPVSVKHGVWGGGKPSWHRRELAPEPTENRAGDGSDRAPGSARGGDRTGRWEGADGYRCTAGR